MAATRLIRWFRENARELPWRRSPRNPYHVVVAEFMLQQTQVERVADRFESFVRRFPTFESLAAATEEEVVEEWSGLGYYRRARLLRGLAVEVLRRGGLPDTAVELEALPGVGPYTAAAVASLAFGDAAPVLDGNTMRVGARLLSLEEDPRSASGRRRVGGWILELMEGQSAGEVNEALMELGATVCSPLEPTCGRCPLAEACAARESGRQSEIPRPKRRRATIEVRWAAACVVDRDGRWLLRQIEDGPILRGLWLPPLVELAPGDDPGAAAACVVPRGEVGESEVAHALRHHITHRRIDVVPVFLAMDCCDPPDEGWRWVDPEKPGVPTSSLFGKLVRAFRVKRSRV